MKQKKIMVAFLAVLVLAFGSITSMAASYSGEGSYVSGTLKTYNTYATATTSNIRDPNGAVYVSVKVQYYTPLGELSTSSLSENSGNGYTSTSRSISGTVVRGESGHGRTKSIEFNLPKN